MQEDFLHFLWRLKKFDLSALKTTRGEPITIQNFGQHNHHSGPDFTDARIRIGDTLWAGNVEMHLKASDWLLHRHQDDGAYNNVILHVVLEEDQVIRRNNGEVIPCLEMKKRIPARLSASYKKLLHNEYWIPCQALFHRVSEITRNMWLDRLLVERLEQKTEEIRQRLHYNKQDWEESFYQALARNFGVKINMDAFDVLAQSIPLLTLSRHKTSLFQMEALLFGQAGMLEGAFSDGYPQKLSEEYRFLRQKYRLRPMAAVQWKFARLRPPAFPTIRIAQLAVLLFQTVHLFDKVLAARSVKEIENMFELSVSSYWQNHYVFDKPSVKRKKSLGRHSIHLFIINTIAPFLFFYGKQRSADRFCEQALRLVEELPPEKNTIIAKWQQLGMKAISGGQTQALLQLKKQYCDRKQCLRCAVGNAVLNP